jgi:7-carboxy-7-deazaguanine synthase
MTKITKNSLLLSEDFYSIQGEGITTGYPSYFVRLANCNLTCGATPKFVNKFKKEERDDTPGSFRGDLEAEGKATWTCDSIPEWAKGTNVTYDHFIKRWNEQNILKDVASGLIHIIWTGGEPTIPMHQLAIDGFMKYFEAYCEENNIAFTPYNEIETNGTIVISPQLGRWLDQINCSPKLSNSGMSVKQRINEGALLSIRSQEKYQFKFVISNEEDIKEMFDTFINPFNIPLTNVCCMPGMDSRENFHERTRWVMEMGMKYKFIALSRMHISAWDQTTGV